MGVKSIFQNMFSHNARHINRVKKIVKQINDLEPEVAKLSDEELKNSAKYFREKLGIDLEKNRKSHLYETGPIDMDELKKELLEERKLLFSILPEAYARVREVAKRVANHRHFDVQLMGGVLLAENFVIEVYTGEGKTNSALLPAFLYGLTGRGVHIHTVNDYLARRDAEWAGHVLGALGLSVATTTSNGTFKWVPDDKLEYYKGKEVLKELKDRDLSNMSTLRGTNLVETDKQTAYKADVLYGEANEFGFDYLRDNMAQNLEERVQRLLYFAIVDEVDSILIDEARTPLIISTPDVDSSALYVKFAKIAKQLERDKHYIVDEKHRSVSLTEHGARYVEKLLNESNIWLNTIYLRHLNNALKAESLFTRDKDYIVKNGKVIIVDEFTGRLQPDRRFSEGLHQAIEAKENVAIRHESKTIASISYQNFYKLYSFLSGMTGTAMTEREEFLKIYDVDVVQVPTYKPIIRKDHPDLIYKTEQGKYNAIVKQIKELNKKGQPVLVGTASIDTSEKLSDLLKKNGVPHQVLNAKYHEKEAHIIANAGKEGSVTIATNMAGRGTDIKIDDKVRELGGLFVIGAQRHEARRIDNQLKGRSGRLGDPGETRFYLSLEDELLRIFGGDIIKNLFEKTNIPEDLPLESGMLTKLIEKAQKKVESMHFDIRYRLVQYDDVLDEQRKIVYELRRIILVLLKREPQDFAKLQKNKNAITIKDFKLEYTDEYLTALKQYTLRDPYNFHLDEDIMLKHTVTPLRFWVLKQLIERFTKVIPDSSHTELTGDAYKVASQFLDLVFPDELWERTLKELGIKSTKEFKKLLNLKKSDNGVVLNSLPIYYAIIASYDLHLSTFKGMQIINFLRKIILPSLDYLWMEHMDAVSDLKEGISLVGYANRDPVVEYKHQAAVLFDKMFGTYQDLITKQVFHLANRE